MVNRPPPRGGNSGGGDSDLPTSPRPRRRSAAGGRASQAGLEWSLRSMHKIDNSSQHFLTNYYGGGGGDSDDALGQSNDSYHPSMEIIEEEVEDQTAFEIFKGDGGGDSDGAGATKRNSVWEALHAPLRYGIVDGQKKVFELLTDVTQPPTTPREERVHRKIRVVNSNQSRLEIRWRFWMMKFTLMNLTILYFVAFIALNLIFGGFFYLLNDDCCGDEQLTYWDNFAFAVQTSTTIGYGSLSPSSVPADFMVIILSYISTLMSTLFAGLLFTKFVTPVINVQFSDVMTLCNVNGVPCLSVRLGNADAYSNRLTDINVRLNYSYQIPYNDHNGEEKLFQQTDELKLLSSRRFGLREVWTLRHVLDETSPLFGLNFEEHPANKIYIFNLSVDAVQDLTKSSVNIQTEYAIEDIVIGRQFVNLVAFDDKERVSTYDYSKMSETAPYPVWYAAKAGVHETKEATVIKEFKP